MRNSVIHEYEPYPTPANKGDYDWKLGGGEAIYFSDRRRSYLRIVRMRILR